jgi:hypothetical protein
MDEPTLEEEEVMIEVILSFLELEQKIIRYVFSKNVSEPEVIKQIFNELSNEELTSLLKISFWVMTDEENVCDWVLYDKGKRWFNQDKNPMIPKPD